jgi:ABC-type transport system involved in multi-copper enzyme maturation permease subunit
MSISAIFYKEITENILTFRNIITTVLCLVLFLTSIFLLYNNYKARLTNYDLRDTEGQLYFGNRPKLTKRPTPLSIFARGLDPDMGRLIVIWQSQPRHRPGGDPLDPGEKNYLLSLFRVPDFSYLVKTVMSLLALFFAFDLICGEKRRGTLRLMLANSVSRGEILLGKWLGGYVSFLLCVLPGLALMFIVVTLLPMVSLNGEDWLRVGIIIVLSFIYISLFFLLGLFISTRVHRPETALILILLVWLIWVMGVPNFSPLIAKRISPVLEMKEIQRQKALIQATSQQEYYEQCWKMNDEVLRTVRNQAALTQHLARVSPLGSYVAAATTMARTGVEDAHRYKAYVMHWDKRRRDLEGAPFGPTWNRAEREEAGLFFAPTEMTLQDSLATIMVDLALLILFNVVFFMGAYLSFLRYDIR